MYIKLIVFFFRFFKFFVNLLVWFLYYYNILKYNFIVWQFYIKRVFDLFYGKGVKYLFLVDKIRLFNEKFCEFVDKMFFLLSCFGFVLIFIY